MTREELLDKLTDVLKEFDELDTSVSLRIIFSDVGVLQGDEEETWWDENTGMFVPVDPNV